MKSHMGSLFSLPIGSFNHHQWLGTWEVRLPCSHCHSPVALPHQHHHLEHYQHILQQYHYQSDLRKILHFYHALCIYNLNFLTQPLLCKTAQICLGIITTRTDSEWGLQCFLTSSGTWKSSYGHPRLFFNRGSPLALEDLKLSFLFRHHMRLDTMGLHKWIPLWRPGKQW